jgi:hypothetical protein
MLSSALRRSVRAAPSWSTCTGSGTHHLPDEAEVCLRRPDHA